ncbi:Structural maintenance of chromosomes protein 4 [Holothuria leucospilota]|uniref:Structural maintenance of chromosomes protein n=1 Tax=Holothuria leucospilota TaxID=206669 RepID=A0A9Q1BPL5_HOLLE|nr:Structural maintenance of chromosomes protein 4 [Holothuria leucospilota]
MPELQTNEENATEGDTSGMTQPNQNGTTEGNMPSSNEQSTSPETPASRLMISQIVTENFKSYAGKVTLGPFHKSFSCIIGPNGSGKSNTIDAMLFVFGYRAAKIRSKKLSVLIHKSDNFKDLSSCSVAVHFQKIIDTGSGDQDYEVIPNSQMVVSRTAYKDGSSQYFINGKKNTFKDVTTLLKDSGIDLDHNRFLILQGEVEQIAMMKPKAQTEHEEGMLEYLEDIIGSNKFKEPIDELAKTVEQLNEERGEKLSRVKAVESEMEQLEKPMQEAQEFLKLENEITRKKNILYQVYVSDCTKLADAAEAKKKEEQSKMAGINKELEELTTDIKTRNKEHKALYKKCEKMTDFLEQKKGDFKEFEQQDVKCREDLKHTKEKQKKLQKNLQKEKTKLENLQAVPGDSEKQIESNKEKKASLEEKLKVEEEKMGEIMASLKTETAGLQAEKEVKEGELLKMQKDVNEARSQMSLAESELAMHKKTIDDAKSKLDKAKADLTSATETLKERGSSIKELEKQIPVAETNLQKLRAEYEPLKLAESKSSQDLHSLVTKVEEAKNSLKSATDRGTLIEALMAQKKQGRIPGIFGRLGDLGDIDDKYDVAISTACAALDHIVVDTIETAEKCVKFLRDNNIGVATFVCLDKISHLQKKAGEKMKMPENVPRLYDLVQVREEKVRMAFYYGLGNTLVAKDLDQATRIALQGNVRHRVVTLQGQLIEQSGTMSGGGSKVSKGRIGCKVVSDITPQELVKIERELEQKRIEATEKREKLKKLEEEVETLDRDVKEMKLTHKKQNMDIKAKSDQEVYLKGQIKTLEEEYKNAQQGVNLDQFEKTAAKHRKEYEKIAEVASKIEAEAKRLHNKIMEIGNKRMKSQQDKIDTLTSLISEAAGAITKATVAIKNATKNIKRAEDNIASMEKEEAECKETMVKIEAEFKRLEDEASKVLEEYKTAESAVKEMEETLEKSKEELAGLDSKQNDLKKTQLEMNHELERYVTKAKENQQKVKHWKKELEKLELHVINKENPEELKVYSEEELPAFNAEEISYQITVSEEQIGKMSPNLAAIQQYKKKEENYLAKVAEYEELTDRRNSQRKSLEDMRKERLDMFMKGFSTINEYLKEMYQMITLGGDAELELVDSLDPFSEGIVFSVRPPKKSWKVIANLSGGEKTLSSLSLVFALHQFKPTPVYVMDEIDAALDFKNVSIVGHYIKERTKNAQFIVISLRNNMFELADRLVGIYKTHDCSKTVAINPQKMATKLVHVAE